MTLTRMLIWMLAVSAVLWAAFNSLPPPEQDLSRAMIGELPLPLEKGEEYSFEFTLPYKASVTLSIAPARQLFWPDLDEIRAHCEQQAQDHIVEPNIISLTDSEQVTRAIYFDRQNDLTAVGRLSLQLQIETLSEGA